MKLLLLIAVLAALTMAAPIDNEEDEYDWEKFKIKFNRNYTAEEDVWRKAIFDANVAMIKEHNKKFAKHETSYGMAVNNFSDMTDEEIKKYMGFIYKPVNITINGSRHAI